ncbi:hypothetical protein RKD27_000535 [Streptomyces sp. SAI-126]|jgi:hypothetical protein
MRDHRLPTSPGFWRSPLRSPWFTSVLGIVLLGGITVLFTTGLVSYTATQIEHDRLVPRTVNASTT